MLTNLIRWVVRYLSIPFAVSIMLLCVGTAHAQTGSITGSVVDASTQRPLPGAQISVAGTNRSAATNAEGRYTIPDIPPGEVEVRATHLGYQGASQQVSVQRGQTATVSFVLNAAALELEGLVVTATGEERQREVGTAVSRVNAVAQVEKTAASNVAELIQGNATGVTVQGSSGTVGSATNVRIRGNSSINLDNTPLVYIDGARINTDARDRSVGGADSDRLLDISPEEIASIEIVKGPAAATLYGTEAAAGVIRITTKKGIAGEARITARTEYGTSWDPNDYPTRAWNPSVDLGPQYADTTYYIDSLKGSADIPDAGLYYDPFRRGEMKKITVSARGGDGDFGYFTLFDATDQEGVFVTNGRQAYNFRGNFNYKPSDKLDVNVSNGFTSSNTHFNYNDGESWGFIGAVLLGKPQWAPIRRADPNGGGEAIVTCPLAYEQARTSGQSLAQITAASCNPNRTFIGSNNFARLATMDNAAQVERYIGSATLTHKPKSFWTNRATVGYDSYTERGYDMIPNVPLKVLDSDPERTVSHVLGRTYTLEGTSALTFDLTPSLNSETTFGAQYYGSKTETTIATGFRFPPGAPTVGNGAATEAGEGYLEIRTLGFFVQQQFGLNDRLFITPAVRYDDNSAFGNNLGSIIYPKISASWVMSEESWFPGARVVDELRLRGAYGTAGKQPGAFDAVTVLTATSVTLPDGSSASGFAPSRVGNPNLKPETGSEIEVGFDAGLLDGRLGVEFTYFDQVTRDALVLRPVPPSTGFSVGVWDNVGEVTNTGFEAAINGELLQNDAVDWSARLGYTRIKSEITRLDEPIAIGGRGLQEHRQGSPYGAYFLRPVTLDADGEIVVADERELVGQPTPTYEGSFSSTLSLFGDRLSLYGQLGFAGGHKMINYTEVYQCRTAFGTCAAKYERDANGQPTRMARLKADPAANFQPYHFLYDASYAKLRTLSARLNLPSAWAQRLNVETAGISLVGSNLLTITDYPGVDPEINSQGRENASQREFFSAGQVRQITLGLTVSF